MHAVFPPDTKRFSAPITRHFRRIDSPHTGARSEAADTDYSHFETGWIKSATDSYQTIDYDYDVRGDQKLWKSGQGREMRREYWPSGKLRARAGVKPSAGPDEVYRYSYEYNLNRSLAKMTDGRLDRTTSYAYDDAERLVRVDESAFAIGEQARRGKDTVLGYDANGNVTSRRTDGRITGDVPVVGEGPYVGGKVASFVYDRLDREVEMNVDPVVGPGRRTVTKWWDSGQRSERWTKRPDSANDTVERTFFFSDGRMSRMDRRRFAAGSGAFSKEKDYGYDLNGNRTADERGTHAYNSRDQLVAWDKPGAGGETVYTLNGSGSIERQSTDGVVTTFAYGPDGERLNSSSTSGVTTSYRYDPAGLGEIVGIAIEGSSADTTFVYDEFGRQKRSDYGQSKSVAFSHDGLDRRDTKTENGKTFDFSYVGASEALSEEQQFSGAETRSYDYDSGMDRLGMARQDGAGFRYRAFSKDANGSVEGLEDDQGNIPDGDRYAYDPYGKAGPAQAGGETGGGAGGGPGGEGEPAGEDAKANPFRFGGHYYDAGVKTYDMQARPYLPEAGRFLTEDRFESASGDLNLEADALTQDRYAFAGGNPVNNIELDGHVYCGDNAVLADCRRRARREQRTNTETPNRGVGREGLEARVAPQGAQVVNDDVKDSAAVQRGVYERADATNYPSDQYDRLRVHSTDTEDGQRRIGFESGETISSPTDGPVLLPRRREASDGNETLGAAFGAVIGNSPGEAAINLFPVGRLANGARRIAGPLISKADDAASATKGGGGVADDVLRAACSFSGETLVLMADGTKKPISQVEVGDRVLATDPMTGLQTARKVTHVWVHRDRIVRLSVDGDLIATTKNHPFWNATDQAWEPVRRLGADDEVLSADGRYVRVDRAGIGDSRERTAYNLTVEGVHTYHVGRLALLVHNTCGPLTGRQSRETLNYLGVDTRRVVGRVKGREPVYRLPGGGVITRDLDGHVPSGAFKVARRPEDLLSKATRDGTFGVGPNDDLVRVGP